MKVLAISTNTGGPSAYLADEEVRVDDLMRRGVIERILLKADWSGAALILEVPDVQAARATLETLPIAAHGLASFDVTPLVERPAHAGTPPTTP